MGGQHTICLGLSVAIAHMWRQCETKKLLVLWNVSIDMIAPVANDFVLGLTWNRKQHSILYHSPVQNNACTITQ